jgi:hypothetical protein
MKWPVTGHIPDDAPAIVSHAGGARTPTEASETDGDADPEERRAPFGPPSSPRRSASLDGHDSCSDTGHRNRPARQIVNSFEDEALDPRPRS